MLTIYGSFYNGKPFTTANICLNFSGSSKYLGITGNVLNPSPAWWFEVLLSFTAFFLNILTFSGILSAGIIHIYEQTLKTYILGFVLQWNARESNKIKSPTLLLILISLHTGYSILSDSGNTYQLSLWLIIPLF